MFYILKSQVERQCYGMITFSTINSLFIYRRKRHIVMSKTVNSNSLWGEPCWEGKRVEGTLSLLFFSLLNHFTAFKVPQEDLRDIESSVLDHCNIVNISIK